MAAGLRATAKALEHAPETKVGAPVLDPTCGYYMGNVLSSHGILVRVGRTRRGTAGRDSARGRGASADQNVNALRLQD